MRDNGAIMRDGEPDWAVALFMFIGGEGVDTLGIMGEGEIWPKEENKIF